MAIGTRHGKQHQLAPAFADVLGARLITPPDLDTDRFGTFSGERPRTLPARDAARAKAHLAMSAADTPYGLATEATYGPLPGTGWPGHEEIALFVDDTRNLEIIEGLRIQSVPGSSRRVRAAADLPDPISQGWPAQACIVRPSSGDDTAAITKGINDIRQLSAAIAIAAARSTDGHAIVEPDLRAHHNPTRQAALIRLARALADRLATACPRCATPGYGRIDVERGLACRICATQTDLPRAEIHGCARCPQRHSHPLPTTAADPRWCPTCNP
ncbi:DUF6671 family protein [Mycobacterium sp.]|uniref:DUF6671 family protein n=1 Tax=Mycobacterium sp. TaxID=1785 RepID=UPI0031DCAD5E